MVLFELSDLSVLSFCPSQITAAEFSFPTDVPTDYLQLSRRKHMLHFLTDDCGERVYSLPDGTSFTARPGDVVFAPDGCFYRSVPRSHNSAVRGVCVCFDLYRSPGERVLFSGGPRLVGRITSTDMHSTLDSLCKTSLRAPQKALDLSADLLLLLRMIIESDPLEEDGLAPAFSYILAHPEDKIPVTFLAELCALSEAQFRRLFCARTGGIPPKEYMLTLRLRRAQQYASQTSLSMDEIAERLGFYDASALSHAYKRKTGTSLFKSLQT